MRVFYKHLEKKKPKILNYTGNMVIYHILGIVSGKQSPQSLFIALKTYIMLLYALYWHENELERYQLILQDLRKSFPFDFKI